MPFFTCTHNTPVTSTQGYFTGRVTQCKRSQAQEQSARWTLFVYKGVA
jgi:hypothetical protein